MLTDQEVAKLAATKGMAATSMEAAQP